MFLLCKFAVSVFNLYKYYNIFFYKCQIIFGTPQEIWTHTTTFVALRAIHYTNGVYGDNGQIRTDEITALQAAPLNHLGTLSYSGTPGGTQTPDTALRRRVLYSPELLGHMFGKNLIKDFTEKKL